MLMSAVTYPKYLNRIPSYIHHFNFFGPKRPSLDSQKILYHVTVEEASPVKRGREEKAAEKERPSCRHETLKADKGR
jgi:hypothetical protein